MSSARDAIRPTISLIMGTIGRDDDVARFLDSLQHQEAAAVELIIVDQSESDSIDLLVKQRGDDAPAIKVVKRPRGVSQARNAGVAHAQGTILGFPDDDCWYPDGLLARVADWFAGHPAAGGLSLRVTNEKGQHSAGGFMSSRSQWISRSNVWRTAVSPGLFVRRRVHDEIVGFDERLGVGAGTRWGSGEETDYLLRAIEVGHEIYYDANRVVYHPRRQARLGRDSIARAWSYGNGMGFVLRKNRYDLARATYYACLPFGSAGLSCLRLAPGQALARAVMGTGRLVGWYAASNTESNNSAPAH